jgi:hypothetical protein
MPPETKLDLKPLKNFAKEKLRKKSTLREILLLEPDTLSTSDFLTKLDIWTALFNMEQQE